MNATQDVLPNGGIVNTVSTIGNIHSGPVVQTGNLPILDDQTLVVNGITTKILFSIRVNGIRD